MHPTRKRQNRHPCTRLSCERLETRALLHGTSISGVVYLDADRDGTRDANEEGLPGVVIQLSSTQSSTSAVEQSTITNLTGAYEFHELEPGTYQLSKRQNPVTIDGQDSTSAPSAVVSNDRISGIQLAVDQALADNNFGEFGLRPEFISIAWFFASAPSTPEILRETIATGEQQAGNATLAESIRSGLDSLPDETNANPIAADDAFSVSQNQTLTVVADGVLANDADPNGDALSAVLASQPAHGTITLNANGSLTYTPTTGFSGVDSFTYRASDAAATSNEATVRITVLPADSVQNQPFGAVTTGSFDAAGLLGIRTDLVSGAPAITATHLTTAISYEGYSNPPTYGPHHGPIGDAQNGSITPRPTGVYTTEQPDEDLVHNLEHGHVWISYNPSLLSTADRTALEKLVTDGGTDTGVILTPRAKNAQAIALASWAHLQTLNSFDATAIRNFVQTNRGHVPEGYIPAGQKPANGETLNDGLPHTP